MSLYDSDKLAEDAVCGVLRNHIIGIRRSAIHGVSSFFNISCARVRAISFRRGRSIRYRVSFIKGIGPSTIPIVGRHLLVRVGSGKVNRLIAARPLACCFNATYGMVNILLRGKVPNLGSPNSLLVMRGNLAYDDESGLVCSGGAGQLFMNARAYFSPSRFFIVKSVLRRECGK